MTGVEDRAMKKRLENADIDPDTVDTNSLDSSVTHSERVGDLERQLGQSLKTQGEEKAELKQAQAQEEHYNQIAEGEYNKSDYGKAEATARAREEGYKKEGNLLEKHFSNTGGEKKQAGLEDVRNIGSKDYKKVPKGPGLVSRVASAVGGASRKAGTYIEERVPLNPISSQSHIQNRSNYLSKSLPVYKSEAEQSEAKHKIQTHKLMLKEQKERIAIQEKQFNLSQKQERAMTSSQGQSYERRSLVGNLPNLSDIAVIKSSNGRYQGLLHSEHKESSFLNSSANLLHGHSNNSWRTRSGPSWKGKRK